MRAGGFDKISKFGQIEDTVCYVTPAWHEIEELEYWELNLLGTSAARVMICSSWSLLSLTDVFKEEVISSQQDDARPVLQTFQTFSLVQPALCTCILIFPY